MIFLKTKLYFILLLFFSTSVFSSNTIHLTCTYLDEQKTSSKRTFSCQPVDGTTNDIPNDEQPNSFQLQTVQEEKPHVRQSPSESIGEEMAIENNNRLFLSESEVLLKPKEVELIIGFNYSKADSSVDLFPLIKTKTVTVPLGLSVGLTEKMEAFASLPMIYGEQKFIDETGEKKNTNDGVGDLTLGVSYQLQKEEYSRPSLTGSFSYTLATGEEPNENAMNAVALTTGFESLAASLSLTKSVDPAVLYLTLGYNHVFAETRQGTTLKPGSSFNYGFGVGFSVNNHVSLNGGLNGSYTKRAKLDGRKITNSGSEPLSMSFGGAYQFSNKKRLQTNVSFGLNEEAGGVSFGSSYGIKF